jgi:hypothetical protein
LIKDTGCNGTVNARGTNALTVDKGNLGVLTGKNSVGGFTTFVDCASKQLWGELIVSPDPTASNCATNPITNAFRLHSDGWGVKVGKTTCIETFVDCASDLKEIKSKILFPTVDRSLFGAAVLAPQNAAHCTDKGLVVEVGPNVDGGIHTYVDPLTQVIESRIVVKPNPSGAACDPATATNGFKLTSEGAAVEVGDSCSIDMFIDCPTQTIRGKVNLNEAGGIVCDGGLKIKVDPIACNSITVSAAGVKGSAKSYAVTKHAGGNAAGFSVSAPNNGDAQMPEITMVMKNEGCTEAIAMAYARTPIFDAQLVAGYDLFAGYKGTIQVDSGSVATFGEQTGYWQAGAGFFAGGTTEVFRFHLTPGQTVTIKMKPYVTWDHVNNSTIGGTVEVHSYALDGWLMSSDVVGSPN